MQQTSLEIFKQKYAFGVEQVPEDSFHRIAYTLAKQEALVGEVPRKPFPDKQLEGLSDFQTYWYYQFLEALNNGAIPAGRISSNIGAEDSKPNTSLINCTVSRNIPDSIEGIAQTLKEAMLTLAKGCGIGFCASSLRPKGAFVNGVGAETSGSLSFLEIWDTMCKTIASAGGRRGAMMLTMHCWHPDIYEFVTKKHEVGKFRQFNLSVLVTDEFMEAVRNDSDWKLVFPLHRRESNNANLETIWVGNFPFDSSDYIKCNSEPTFEEMVQCKVYKTVKARELWDLIMKSTYDYAEPAIIAIDLYNKANPLNCAETIVATNPCGEQGLPEFGSCLLGSVILSKFVRNPFKQAYEEPSFTNPDGYTGIGATFDWQTFDKTVRTFVRMLDNVVELHGLALPEQAHEILHKRRHGMGYTGLGTTLNLLGMKYGSPEAIGFCEEVTKRLAVINLEESYKLGAEKGCAPIFEDDSIYGKWLEHHFTQKVLSESITTKAWYNGKIAGRPRFTHATSIAPTGTISIAFGNNCSNGIEPSFAHSYFRNVIIPNKKTKKRVEVLSEEALLWGELHGDTKYPEWFVTTQDITPEAHIAMQAAAQKWIDSSISKTINCPSDISFEDFKDIYLNAYEAGLKGVTTYRPSGGFTAVLQTSEHLETIYEFTLEDGTTVKAKASDTIWYDGEEHEVENLFCALNEGYYGKL